MTYLYVWHVVMSACDITQSYIWHDPLICVTWTIHVCDMTHSYVCRDIFICVTWLIHMCDMTYSCVWHDSFISILPFGADLFNTDQISQNVSLKVILYIYIWEHNEKFYLPCTHTHTHTHTYTHTHIHTYTHTLFLFLSLSLSHTHTHTRYWPAGRNSRKSSCY